MKLSHTPVKLADILAERRKAYQRAVRVRAIKGRDL